MMSRYKFCSICGSGLKPLKGNLACVKCPFINYRNPRPTVTALILHKNKLLFTKRNNKPFKGWWDLPGGFVDKGEGAERALERELREELGLRKIKEKKLFGVYRDVYEDKFDPCYTLSVAYTIKVGGEKIFARDKEEILGIGWFSKKEIPKKIAFKSNQKIAKDFIRQWK